MSSRPEEDLSCPVCHDIFKDPVVLSCSHSFCRTCLQKWWKAKISLECPCCKRKSSRSNPPRNLALRNLCEAFQREREQQASVGSEHLCSLHSEKLKIFCLDHQEPVCVICRDSKIHRNHQFRPLDEAAQECREELQKFLKPLQEKLKLLQEAKGDGDQTVKFIKLQTQHTEKQIREQFQKLQQFLQQEEKAKVAALREEEEKKTQAMTKKMEALSREIAALSVMITAAQEELRATDISFLKNYQTTVKRVQLHPLQEDPQPISGALIDVVKHLGNLTFNIWNAMKQTVSYSPVILDPNTADPELVLSSDLNSIQSGNKKPLPRNPERTKFSCSVLGSEGFTSGSHSWSVNVGTNKDWELGMLGENLQTKGCLKAQLWRISFSDGKFTAFSTSEPEKDLPVKDTLKRIRVHLDFDRGRLSFFDLDANTHIHTFTHNFTDILFPYIYTESPAPLRIIPANISVRVQNQT
ncbi:E3 ubiquitin-protein ligase TRIM35-like [Girardinichthys multiradiatus]|uniref:E3 ubiquitin-protein ligase TRIM35-like n=1 Tax=Girardinichthys multiradiatus TaxID=208333 RepID=UPI001FABCF54|nr:E3 ubiquitin-protein ligase TRIM35-like [Girardinichthys multiradiatus]